MSSDALKKLALESKEQAWIHRLGFLLDKQSHHTLAQALYETINKKPVNSIPLVPYSSLTGAPRDKKWSIAINTTIESDL